MNCIFRRMRRNMHALIEIVQTISEQLYCPNRCWIAELKRISLQLTQNACGRDSLGDQWTTTSRQFLKCCHSMPVKIAAHAVVDRLLTNASDFSDFLDHSSLRDEQHGLYSLESAFVFGIFQRFLEPRRVRSIKAQFCEALCFSHEPSLLLMFYFSKNFCHFT